METVIIHHNNYQLARAMEHHDVRKLTSQSFFFHRPTILRTICQPRQHPKLLRIPSPEQRDARMNEIMPNSPKVTLYS